MAERAAAAIRDGQAETILITYGSDQLTRMGHCGDHGDYTCIVAPATGWCAVGDVEHNMARRYSKVEYTPGTATP
jgi:hypothetical protein